jgi:hypothetical protein
MYLEQIAPGGHWITKTIERLKLGAFGISTELSLRGRSVHPDAIEAVGLLESHRERRGLITHSRPSRMFDFRDDGQPQFHKEVMLASRITFPGTLLDAVRSLSSLSVWISEPKLRDLGVERKFEFHGCFLYLVEGRYEDHSFATAMSGCSALQAVVNIAMTCDLVSTSNGGEPFGRDTYAHPTEKLRVLGVKAAQPRRITALYKRRYMSDEQCYSYRGIKYSTCDLLGYPLYIYAHD